MSKTITLGDWLKGAHCIEVFVPTNRPGAHFSARDNDGHIADGTAPEDALQALCEAYHRDEDALLDLGRSAAWQQAHGPDGVSGLCDGEAGVVVCRDGALHLLDRFPAKSHFVWAQNIEDLRTMVDQAADVVPLDGSGDLSVRNTFEPDPPSDNTD